VIRETIPPEELDIILDNIGLPTSLNLGFTDTATIASFDGEILVSLNKKHGPTQKYAEELRNKLIARFPDMTFFYQPADMVTQVLNFGLPAPIDIQIVGADPKNRDVAREIRTRVAAIPGAIDVHLAQVLDYPELFVNIDRTRAQEVGLTQRDVASDLLVSLNSGFQTAPNFWLDWKTGVTYNVMVMTPQYKIHSIDTLQNTTATSTNAQLPQLVSNLATIDRDVSPSLVSAHASLGQAKANLRQAITNMQYTRVTYERWRYLASQRVVSDQDRDQTWEAYNAAKATVDAMQANVNVAMAAIAANEANVRQLMALQGFKRIFAPFAGIISARNVEVGSLVNAGSGSNVSASTGGGSAVSAPAGGGAYASTSTGAPPTGATVPGRGAAQISPGIPSAGGGLFQIARIDTLRIYINVPQTFSNSIKPGRKVEIDVREFPQDKFTGKVARTTSALDPASRTLLVEVQTANPDYKLLPGMYATVKVSVYQAEPPIRIPATALVIRADGPQVAIVTKDQKAHFQKVVIGRRAWRDDVIGHNQGEEHYAF
jgi:multidrug efflux pump subunit AcrA (membrane-fusion protein)